MTPTEKVVFDILVGLGLKFEAQKAIGPFIVDFWVKKPRCIIECDGGYHYNRQQQTKDIWRGKRLLEFCGRRNTRLLRFRDDEIVKPDFRDRLSWQLYRASHPFERKIQLASSLAS